MSKSKRVLQRLTPSEDQAITRDSHVTDPLEHFLFPAWAFKRVLRGEELASLDLVEYDSLDNAIEICLFWSILGEALIAWEECRGGSRRESSSAAILNNYAQESLRVRSKTAVEIKRISAWEYIPTNLYNRNGSICISIVRDAEYTARRMYRYTTYVPAAENAPDLARVVRMGVFLANG